MLTTNQLKSVIRVQVVLILTVGTILFLDRCYNDLVNALYNASTDLSNQSFYLGCTLSSDDVNCQDLTQKFVDGKI